ncbi:MAG: hypothetical protein KJ971_03895 [Firmicutes bacterium]|nr:hypothetical protein [Bacillota bacterium]
MKNQTKQTQIHITTLHLLLYVKFKLKELLLVEIAVLSLLGYCLYQSMIEYVIILAFLALLYIMFQIMKIVVPMIKHRKAVQSEPVLEFEFLDDEVVIQKVNEKASPLTLPYSEVLLLLETKKCFYIVLEQKMGFVLEKANFENVTLGSFKIFLNEKNIAVQK